MKSNAVSKFLDISEQDNSLEFRPTDFQDDLDSTVLVRERSRGSKLEGAFERKAGRFFLKKIGTHHHNSARGIKEGDDVVKTRHRKAVKRTEENHRHPEKKTRRFGYIEQ